MATIIAINIIIDVKEVFSIVYVEREVVVMVELAKSPFHTRISC